MFNEVCTEPGTTFMLVSCSVSSLTLNMKAVNSSEMSDDFQQTTGRYPEGRTRIISVRTSTHSFFLYNLQGYNPD
jgi:hypothetical protein